MKKLFTFMAAICCAMVIMADEKPQLDSMIVNIPTLGGKQKYVYTYDKKGRKTEEIYSYWEEKTARWEKNYKYTAVYDASNDTTCWTRFNWDGTNWVNDQKKEYTWKAKGIKTVETTANWKDNAWVPATKNSWTYNSNNKCTEYMCQVWSTSDNGWVNNYRETYTVNSSGLRVFLVEESWSNNAWKNTKKEEYSYNKDNQITDKTEYTWSNDDWQGMYVYVYTYKNGLLTESSLWKIDPNKPDFDPYSQTLYTYDDNNNLTKAEYFDWDNTGEGSWKKSFEYVYTCNSNNDMLTQIRREWNDDKTALVETQKVENAYDAKTGVLLRTRFYVLSTTTKKLELAYTATYYYQGVEPLGIVKVISNQPSAVSGHKFFRNGQLLIERDGKTYTISGQEIE